MTLQLKTSRSTTGLGTLWSETLLEMLYDALQHNWSPNAIREILAELQRKGYGRHRVIKKLNKRFGDDGPKKLLLILSAKR